MPRLDLRKPGGGEGGGVDELPAGGDTGQALVKASGANGDVTWAAIGDAIPPIRFIQSTTPADPEVDDLWLDTADFSLWLWWDDGDSEQWVAVSGPTGPAGSDGAPGAPGEQGIQGPPGPASDPPNASESTPGLIQLATSEGTVAGSDTFTAVTPATLKAALNALRAQSIGVVEHGANSAMARPTLGFFAYHWYGTVEPTNMSAVDEWKEL